MASAAVAHGPISPADIVVNAVWLNFAADARVVQTLCRQSLSDEVYFGFTIKDEFGCVETAVPIPIK